MTLLRYEMYSRNEPLMAYAKAVLEALKQFDSSQGDSLKTTGDFEKEKWTVTITLGGEELKFKYRQRNVSEEDPDPRGFGDADHVVKAAMQDWYPGKMNHYTIKYLALTGMGFETEELKVGDFSTWDGSLDRQLYNIVDKVQELVRAEERRQEKEQAATQVATVQQILEERLAALRKRKH